MTSIQLHRSPAELGLAYQDPEQGLTCPDRHRGIALVGSYFGERVWCPRCGEQRAWHPNFVPRPVEDDLVALLFFDGAPVAGDTAGQLEQIAAVVEAAAYDVDQLLDLGDIPRGQTDVAVGQQMLHGSVRTWRKAADNARRTPRAVVPS